MNLLQANIGFCWPPGAGGNFLLSLRHKNRCKINHITQEYHFSNKDRIHIDFQAKTSDLIYSEIYGTEWFKSQKNKKNQLAFTFHEFPLQLLKTNSIDITSKNFFVIKCDDVEIKYVSLLYWLYKCFDLPFSEIDFSVDMILNFLETKESYSDESIVFKLAKAVQLDRDLKNKLNYINYETISSVSAWYFSDCIKQNNNPSHQGLVNYIKATYNEYLQVNQQRSLESSQENYNKLANSGYNIIELSYSDVFFKKTLPHSFTLVHPATIRKEIHDYSQARLRWVEQLDNIVDFDWPVKKFILEKQALLNKS